MNCESLVERRRALMRVLVGLGALFASGCSGLFLPWTALAGDEKPIAGYVIEIQGSWSADSVPLKKGRMVRSGAVLRATLGESRHCAVTIVPFAENSKPLSFQCNGAACGTVFHVPESAPPSSSLASRLASEAMRLVSREPKRYVSSGVRGDGRQLLDGVVPVEDGQLDLFPLIRGLVPDTYTLSLEPLGGSGARTTITFAFECCAGQRATTKGAPPSGLYRARIKGASGEAAAGDSWLLVAEPAAAAAQAKRFDEAVSLTRGWGPAVASDAAREFLRACLDAIHVEHQATGAR